MDSRYLVEKKVTGVVSSFPRQNKPGTVVKKGPRAGQPFVCVHFEVTGEEVERTRQSDGEKYTTRDTFYLQSIDGQDTYLTASDLKIGDQVEMDLGLIQKYGKPQWEVISITNEAQ